MTAASETSSATPPPPPPGVSNQNQPSTPIPEDEDSSAPTLSIDGGVPDRSKAAFPLAHKLYTNVLSDIKKMKEERSEALFASLGEFRVLLGDLDNVRMDAPRSF